MWISFLSWEKEKACVQGKEKAGVWENEERDAILPLALVVKRELSDGSCELFPQLNYSAVAETWDLL